MPKTKEEKQAAQQAVDESWEQVAPGTALALSGPPRQLGRPLTIEQAQLALMTAPTLRSLWSTSIPPDRAAAMMMMAYELGFAMTTAGQFFDWIDGPVINGAGIMALIQKSQLVEMTIQDHLDQNGNPFGCTVTMKRRDNGFFYGATFTMQDAQRAGLLGKANWQAYPGDMLCWRAIAKVAKRVVPDLLAGLSLANEIDADAPIPPQITVSPAPSQSQPPANVDPKTGEIIEEGRVTISDTPPSQQPLDANGISPGGQELLP